MSGVTDHARKRVKKRIANTDADKQFSKALKHGYDRTSYSGSYRRYLDKLAHAGNANLTTYNGCIYIHKAGSLITVWQVPTKYRKYKPSEERSGGTHNR